MNGRLLRAPLVTVEFAGPIWFEFLDKQVFKCVQIARLVNRVVESLTVEENKHSFFSVVLHGCHNDLL